MFTIIGGDGREYGPVTTEQIRGWIAAGRASLETQARRDGTVEWHRLGDFPEFVPPGTQPPVLDFVDTSVAPVAGAPGPAAPAHELASRSSRLGAAMIDAALGLLCATPGALVMGGSFFTVLLHAGRGETVDPDPALAGRMLVGVVLFGLAMLALCLVQIVMLSLRGQTIGKRLLGLRIVRYADHSPAGFVHAWLLRSFVPGIIGVVPYLGYLFGLVDICFIFGDERRCLHDYIAGTKVVKD